MAKMAKFWKAQWASRAWVVEMVIWADAQKEPALLKQFLADYAEQPLKGNVPFLRKKVKEFVANVFGARVEAAKRKAPVNHAAEQPDMKVEINPLPEGAVKFEPVVGPVEIKTLPEGNIQFEPIVQQPASEPEQPKYVTEGKMAEVVRDLQGSISALRDQTTGQTEELRKQVEQLKSALTETAKAAVTKTYVDGQVAALRKEVVQYTRDGLDSLQRQVNGKAPSGDLVGLVSSNYVDTTVAEAKSKWAEAVREAIWATLEGKTQNQFLEWWDRAVNWLNERPKQEEEK